MHCVGPRRDGSRGEATCLGANFDHFGRLRRLRRSDRVDAMNEETLEARSETKWPSVNREVVPLVEALIRDAQALRVAVTQGPLGETLIDCGVRAVGGLEAGRRLGEICLGGLGRVSLETTDPASAWPFLVTAHTGLPVHAFLGSRFARLGPSLQRK